MAYEKQFWEQPHHDSSEEERLYSLVRMQAKTIELNKKTFLEVQQVNQELLKALEMLLDHVTEDTMNTNWSDVISITKDTISKAKNIRS
jgi:hypothetical protein